MIEEEIWKELEETGKAYAVSNLGRFKRLARKAGNKNLPERVLKLSPYSNGYLQFSGTVNSKRITAISHRLVAKYFIPNPNDLPQVNHKNGVKTDNKVSNLEWSSVSDNILHSYHVTKNHIPRDMSGTNNTNCKVTEDTVLKVRELNKNGVSNKEIMVRLSLSANTVTKIVTRRTWKHI